MIANEKKLSPIMLESLEHGKQVAYLAKTIFDGLEPLHCLFKDWRNILDLGAQFHDIGWIYGKTAHHKNSASMIRSDYLGITKKIPNNIRHLVALVARYHRRAEPSLKQWRFAALNANEQEAIMILASIIRLADALDFCHASNVQKLNIEIKPNAVHFEIEPSENCLTEIQRVAVKKELFSKVFLLDVICF